MSKPGLYRFDGESWIKEPMRKARISVSPIYLNGVETRLVEMNGREQFVIVVNDALTIDSLRKAWPEICRAREDNQSVYGPDLKDFKRRHLVIYDAMNKRGENRISYRQISEKINHDYLFHLCTHLINEGYMFDQQEGKPYAFLLLKAMGMKDEDIKAHFKHDLEAIVESAFQTKVPKLPWPTLADGPVSGQRVRNKLKHFRKSKEYRRMKIGRRKVEVLNTPTDELMKDPKAEKAKELLQALLFTAN